MENSNQYDLNQQSYENITVIKKKKSKLPLIISIIAILVIVVILLAVFVFSKSARYNKAMKLMDDGKYEDAYEILQKFSLMRIFSCKSCWFSSNYGNKE